MKKFKIKCISNKGQIKEFNIEAFNQQELEELITKQGYYIISIEVERKSLYDLIQEIKSFITFTSIKELLDFSKLFRTLLKAGLPVKDAFDAILEDSPNTSFYTSLRSIRNDIIEGVSLSSALARHPNVFPDIYVKTIMAGEKVGALDKVLERLSIYYQRIISIRRKILSSITYPIILLLVALSAILFMMIKVVPEFIHLFKNLDIPLPKFTAFILHISEIITQNIIVILIIFIILIYLIYTYVQTKHGRIVVDEIMLKIPLIGNIQEKLCYSQFARTVATLLNGGIPLLDALDIAIQSLSNNYIAMKFQNLPELISKGYSFANCLKYTESVPKAFIKVVKVGEESGSLAEVLDNIAEYYEDEISDLTATLLSLIEPILFLLISLILGSFIISLLLPILTAAGNLK